MKLRKELEPLERTQEFKDLLKSKIENIEYLIENNMDYMNQISDFNSLTGKNYDRYYFQTYWGCMSLDEFVHNACTPEPKKVSDITKEELVELVRRVIDIERYGPDQDFYIELLDANILMPEICDLIFQRQEELTPEAIIELALDYKPILL